MNDLLLENIHKTFPIHHGRGKQVVLDDISLRVRPGERWGIMGPNGAGKSTIIQIISGSLTPDSGTVHRGMGKVLWMFSRSKSFIGCCLSSCSGKDSIVPSPWSLRDPEVSNGMDVPTL